MSGFPVPANAATAGEDAIDEFLADARDGWQVDPLKASRAVLAAALPVLAEDAEFKERIARALADVWLEPHTRPWNDLHSTQREQFRDDAQSLLAALFGGVVAHPSTKETEND